MGYIQVKVEDFTCAASQFSNAVENKYKMQQLLKTSSHNN